MMAIFWTLPCSAIVWLGLSFPSGASERMGACWMIRLRGTYVLNYPHHRGVCRLDEFVMTLDLLIDQRDMK